MFMRVGNTLTTVSVTHGIYEDREYTYHSQCYLWCLWGLGIHLPQSVLPVVFLVSVVSSHGVQAWSPLSSLKCLEIHSVQFPSPSRSFPGGQTKKQQEVKDLRHIWSIYLYLSISYAEGQKRPILWQEANFEWKEAYFVERGRFWVVRVRI